jgi:chorismate mutase-like protein
MAARRLSRACLAAAWLALAPACWGCDSADLFALVEARLGLMPAVAAWKYARGQPVEDLERERQVSDRAREDAIARGLAPGPVAGWVRVQVAMAKMLQRRSVEAWRGGAPVPPERDLAGDLRPRLLVLGSQQLDTLGCLLRTGQQWGAAERSQLEQALAGLEPPPVLLDALWRALLEVRLAEPVPGGVRPPASSS